MSTVPYIHTVDLESPDLRTISSATHVTVRQFEATLRRSTPPLPGVRGPLFPTTGEHWVRMAAFAPTARVTWGFFAPAVVVPDGASVAYRVFDGADSRFYSGGSWGVAGAGDWNTLAEVNTNLGSYTGSSIALEVRLISEDGSVTPRVRGASLVWHGRPVETLRSWVYETVIESLAAEVRLEVESTVTLTASTSSFVLADNLPRGISASGISAVYDHTDDPNKTTNLLASFNGTTVTLTATVAAEHVLRIVVLVAPDVAMTTDIGWPIEPKGPSIWITDLRTPNTGKRSLGVVGPFAIDPTTVPVPAGVVWPKPVPLHSLEFTYALYAPRGTSLVSLAEAVVGWLEEHPVLVNRQLGEGARLHPRDVLQLSSAIASFGDPQMSSGSFTLYDIPWYTNSAKSSASGLATAPSTPIEAGDPAAPGVGYATTGLTANLGTETAPAETTETS